MSLHSHLRGKREILLRTWLDRVLDTYPADAHRFLRNRSNRFDNPVGTTLRRELPVLFDALFENSELETVVESLDAILHIRSVQEFSPAEAVGFIFLLKQIVRDELAAGGKTAERYGELVELETRIDRLAMIGFDIYSKCRDRMAEIRVNAARREMFMLQRLVNKYNVNPEEEVEGDNSPP